MLLMLNLYVFFVASLMVYFPACYVYSVVGRVKNQRVEKVMGMTRDVQSFISESFFRIIHKLFDLYRSRNVSKEVKSNGGNRGGF